MNEIPETIPWVIASFGNSDGCSDDANIKTPVSTPGLETGLENTFASRVCSINANDDTPRTYAAGERRHFPESERQIQWVPCRRRTMPR
jgi:hypothetical protein